jgi:hypothetical protein
MNSDLRQLSDKELDNYLEVFEKKERQLLASRDRTRTYELEMVGRTLLRLRREKGRRGGTVT